MTPEETAARLQKRVAQSTTDDLLSWADQAASGMQRELDDFRRDADEAHLAEISLAALTMGAAVDEIALRLRQHRSTMSS